jgi:serine protease AprX
MNSAPANELIPVIIKPCEQPDLRALAERISGMRGQERRDAVIIELESAASKNHAPILAILNKGKRTGSVGRVRSLWLANVVAAEVTKSVVSELADCPFVSTMGYDACENALADDAQGPDETPRVYSSMMPDTVWNLGLVDAPCVWEQGYTGQDIIVGHFDTGVNYNHLDLADHVWKNADEVPGNLIDDDGNGYIDDYYGYDFATPDADPRDDNGHGTHTAGTVAGDGTAGRNTGVAPDARIMSLKVLNSIGSGSQTDTWEAMQYAITNGASIFTMSMGWLHHYDPDRGTWRSTFEAAMLAGISSAVAAGNERQYMVNPYFMPPPDNVRTPGDVPPPWLSPYQTLTGGVSGVVTAAATTASDIIADFSSMGPVTWSSYPPWNDYPYNPQMGLLDPDVAAPGSNITSLAYTSNNGYVGGPSWSGTSMATPHIAGLMALMLSKNPNLTPSQIDSIIETTSLDLGTTGKDNDYGSGRIRACDAVNAVGIEEPVTEARGAAVSSIKVSPNPFRGRTTIVITLAESREASTLSSIVLYDQSGRRVRQFDSLEFDNSTTLVWDGKDSIGRMAAPGVYFLSVRTTGSVYTSQLVLVR